jgi:hypothetical protein
VRGSVVFDEQETLQRKFHDVLNDFFNIAVQPTRIVAVLRRRIFTRLAVAGA